MVSLAQLLAAYAKARADLLAAQTAERYWEGKLSSSSLSTATAISTLAIAGANVDSSPQNSQENGAEDQKRIADGLCWLLADQNTDGGWGDTDKSHSNISTTMLAVAAIHLARQAEIHSDAIRRATAYIDAQGGIDGLRRRYGRDKTFAVPILSNYALAGLIDWSFVAPLPFELACVPQRFYRWVRMPVVSYAIPALVAIGQARYFHHPPRLPWSRLLRRAAVNPSLRVLEQMQPTSGGYLEAVPLTSFVTMNLAGTGRVTHPVAQKGLEFIRRSVRSDGSWPIDENLATWNTTLAINALAASGEDVLPAVNIDWLLACQHSRRHPFTGANPGGWGWTDLPGAVPDADDTAGALLALANLHHSPHCQPSLANGIRTAAHQALTWLLDLQNRDGGWPTFCRGWGKLPFDRSGADLTAHAMRALHHWQDGIFLSRSHASQALEHRINRAIKRGWRYLHQQQRPDGSWVPLWFGNQNHPQEENPVFGTSRVLKAFCELGFADSPPAQRGTAWLQSAQRPDGGWSGWAESWSESGEKPPGGESSVEETALAVDALLGDPQRDLSDDSLTKGLDWLIEAVLADRHQENAPIGFYFAKLWYYERLYPLVFSVAALGHAVARFVPEQRTPQ